MSFVKHSNLDIASIQEEKSYQLEEALYHIKSAQCSLYEVKCHLDDFKSHAEQYNNLFKEEVLYG